MNYVKEKKTAGETAMMDAQSDLGLTGRGSLIRSESAWYASGPEFNPHVWHILSWRLGHENISTTVLPLR